MESTAPENPTPSPESPPPRRLTRSRTDRVIGGVCGGIARQGNLDPTLVFAPPDVLDRKVREVLEEGKAAEGHVFNLGHGVLPETDPDVLGRLRELVHERTAAAAAA